MARVRFRPAVTLTILTAAGVCLLVWRGSDRENSPAALAIEATLGTHSSAQELQPPELASVPEEGGRAPVVRQEAPPPGAARTPSASERLLGLKESLRILPAHDGTMDGIQEKYAGLGPRDLKGIYQIVREIYREDLFRNLDEGIEAGRYVTEIVASGQAVDFTKYAIPDQELNVHAHRATPLPGGGQEYKIVVFDKVGFPDMYVRALEESWVHHQIHQAGLCEEGK